MSSHQKELYARTEARLMRLHSESKAVSKLFGRNTIAIEAFKEISANVKVVSKGDESKDIETFYVALNKTIDTITKVCIDFAVKNDSKQIPLEYIRKCVAQSLTAFRTSVK